MVEETKKEETTIWDFLKQKIACKIYQIGLIFLLGVIVGSLFK